MNRLPPVVDPYEALKDEVIVRDDKEVKTNRIWHWEAGDPAMLQIKSLTDATPIVVKQNMYIPRIHVASIETCGMVANWDKIKEHLTIYMTSQAPHAHRTVVARWSADCRNTRFGSSRRTLAAASAAKCRFIRVTFAPLLPVW